MALSWTGETALPVFIEDRIWFYAVTRGLAIISEATRRLQFSQLSRDAVKVGLVALALGQSRWIPPILRIIRLIRSFVRRTED